MLLDSAKAKDGMLTICRRVSGSRTKQYVSDKTGRPFMTLDYKPRGNETVFVEISAQRFKDNFARCSALVRLGVQFKLSIASSNTIVYARRHTNYRDACDDLVEEWRNKIVAEKEDDRTLAAIRSASLTYSSENGELQSLLAEIKRGVALLAIGHKPFDEGLLGRDDVDQ